MRNAHLHYCVKGVKVYFAAMAASQTDDQKMGLERGKIIKVVHYTLNNILYILHGAHVIFSNGKVVSYITGISIALHGHVFCRRKTKYGAIYLPK